MAPDDVLRSPHFWRAYFDPESLDLSSVEKWPFSARRFRFDLTCGPRFAIRAECSIDDLEFTLLLVELASGAAHQLAWFDQARSHPFALHWDELMQLDRYWRSSSHDRSMLAARVLLLSPFVGTGSAELDQLVPRRHFVANALMLVGITDAGEAQALSERAICNPPEEDYAWVKDEQFGWLFSGDYPCYSLRNLAHSGGAESQFPFEKLHGLLADIAL